MAVGQAESEVKAHVLTQSTGVQEDGAMLTEVRISGTERFGTGAGVGVGVARRLTTSATTLLLAACAVAGAEAAAAAAA